MSLRINRPGNGMIILAGSCNVSRSLTEVTLGAGNRAGKPGRRIPGGVASADRSVRGM